MARHGLVLSAERNQRGQVLTSVLAAVSVIVLIGAVVGLFAGGDSEDTSKAAGAAPTSTPSATESTATPTRTPKASPDKRPTKEPTKQPTKESQQPTKKPTKDSQQPTKKPTKQSPPPIPDVYVEVYNNAGITGLAAETAARLQDAGWQVVATDNWYGDIPQSTVYYPSHLQAEAQQLARALGITRTWPAVSPMNFDRLTVILTSDYSG